MPSLPTVPFISCEDVTLRRGDRRVVHDLTWHIHRGEQWAVIGPNGAGKSTLAGALCGRVPVVGGRIRRHHPEAAIEAAAQVGFEDHRELIAREMALDHGRHFSGRPDAVARGRDLVPDAATAARLPPEAREMLERLGDGHRLDRPLRALSTGEIRRLLMVRALARDPRLIVLDEPFDGLDKEGREAMARLVNDLACSGRQIVLVTHRFDELPDAVTHILLLVDGRRQRAGHRAEVLPETRGNAPGTDGGTPPAVRPAVSPAAPLVEMCDLRVAYGTIRIFERFNWRMAAGENWMIQGPNGVGKSTLLRLITADHLQAYANRIRLFGRPRGSGETIWAIKQRIGMVSAEFQIAYRRSIAVETVVVSGFFDSIGLYRQASGMQRTAARAMMSRFGLEELAGRSFDRLSQGQQRMVLLARAMVKSPRLLVLDEPCQGLDTENRRRILEQIDAIGASDATDILYVTHTPEDRLHCLTHRLTLTATPNGPAAAAVECLGDDG